MIGFGLNNLRRLVVDQPVDIRPITVLVGRNSSGKSTFLRTFPLIRQSITTRTSSPVLWYGDLVDFGDFEGAVFNNDTSLSVMLTFCLDKTSRNAVYFFDGEISSEAVQYHDVSQTVSISKKDGGTRLSAIRLSEGGNGVVFEMVLGEDRSITSILVDGVDLSKDLGGYRLVAMDASLFPDLIFFPPRPEGNTKPSAANLASRRGTQFIDDALVRLIKPHIDKRTGQEKLRKLIRSFRSLSKINETSLLTAACENDIQTARKFFQKVSEGGHKEFYTRFRLFLLLAQLPRILNAMNQSLKEMLGSVLYIGPARARSDRYYRYQDLSVSEIDPDGKNFAMFLSSLPEKQMLSFSSWVKSLFGYGVKVNTRSGHITISLEYENKSVNIVDTGYGISQILPVLGQIWWADNGTRRGARRQPNKAPLLAIEQPELHLHPAHQALLADAFVSGFKSNGASNSEAGTHFIIETHSEALINRLGALVSEQKLSKEDVQILVFESRDSKTVVNVANFDDDGQLSGWPFGFFLPDV